MLVFKGIATSDNSKYFKSFRSSIVYIPGFCYFSSGGLSIWGFFFNDCAKCLYLTDTLFWPASSSSSLKGYLWELSFLSLWCSSIPPSPLFFDGSFGPIWFEVGDIAYDYAKSLWPSAFLFAPKNPSMLFPLRSFFFFSSKSAAPWFLRLLVVFSIIGSRSYTNNKVNTINKYLVSQHLILTNVLISSKQSVSRIWMSLNQTLSLCQRMISQDRLFLHCICARVSDS